MFIYLTIAVMIAILIASILGICHHSMNNGIAKITTMKCIVLIILFAIILGCIIAPLQIVKDTITLTAMGTGEKGTEGVDEVFFNRYIVDGKEYLPLESLEIENGKWFWANNAYAWRLETDKRQPDGVTRDVQFKIPVGENRQIVFQTAPYCGEVQIQTNNKIQILNTYSESYEELSYDIGSSSYTLLIANILIKIIIFAILFTLFVYTLLKLMIWYQYSLEKVKQWLNVHDVHLICGMIALIAFIFMITNSTNDSFWGDELMEIEFISNGVIYSLKNNMLLMDCTPPLYNILCAILYEIIPYGQQWLLLISVIPTAISIYLIGCIAYDMAGKYAGVLASIFMATSSTVYVQVAWELRAYSFTMFFVVLSMYAFQKKITTCRLKYKILFSIFMIGLAMSHYFGMLICVFYFLGDLYLLFKKKNKLISQVYIYLAPGGLSLLWFIIIYINALRERAPKQILVPKIIPGIYDLRTEIFYLVGNSEIAYYILLIGLSFSTVCILSKKIEDNEFIYLHSSFTVIGVLVGLVIFGRYISKDFTLWEPRYFTVLIPAICIVCAFITNKIIKRINSKNFAYTVILTLFIVQGFYGIPLASETKLAPKVESAANEIYSDINNVYNDTSLVVEAWWGGGNGFNEYYLSQKGRREYLNCIHYTQLNSYLQNGQEYNRIYVVDLVKGYAAQVSDSLLKNGFVLSEELSDIGLYIYDRIA